MKREKPTAEYDAIAEKFAAINYQRPLFRYAVYASLFAALGNLSGKYVLDLACGDGKITRKIKRLGAVSVTGIDISKEMIRLARGREKNETGAISYQVERAGNLHKIGNYDVVTGAFLLHYAKTEVELRLMCGDIAANLKDGGVFTGVINNPDFPLNSNPEYQNTITADHYPIKEGDVLKVDYEVNGIKIGFNNYFWTKNTYESVFSGNGLKCVWIPISPTQEGIEKMGDDFWRRFLERPFFVIIKAQRLADAGLPGVAQRAKPGGRDRD